MESNKLYESLLSLPLVDITSVEFKSKELHIYCESKLASCHCPSCLEPCEDVNQTRTRIIQDLSISDKQVFLHVQSRQFLCHNCPRTFYERFNFVSKHERMTTRYEDFIYKRCIGVDLNYVSLQEDLCWDTVNRIFKKWANKKIKSCNLFEGVRALGIDEIALKKGHKNFVCVLVNLETGEVIDILEDRTKAALIPYFQKLGSAFCEGIEIFSSDMWEGYINTAKEVFPNASIVVDRFHFFAHLQKAVDSCRKALRKEFPDAEELKNVKWLFLKNKENLSPEQKQQIETLLANPAYEQLKEVYQAKESFRDILEQDISPQQADKQLTQWVIQTLEKHNKYLNKFVNTFTNWYNYILNYFDGRWSNGMVEGINNRIKMMKRRAFGYNDFQSFRTRVLVEFMAFH